MRIKTFAGFALTIIASAIGCTSSVEHASPSTTTGAGGTGGAGGQDASGGSGEQTAPHIDAVWIKVLPNLAVHDLLVDKTNHFVVLGLSFGNSQTTFDGIPTPPGDVFAAKLDPDGNLVWLRSFGNGRVPRAVATGPDHRVLILSKTPKVVWGVEPPNPQWERFFLTAFSEEGVFLWEQSFGGDFDQYVLLDSSGSDLAVDAQGAAVVAASFAGQFDTPMGTFQTATDDHDVFFLRFDTDGSIIDVKQFAVPGREYVNNLAIDSVGHVVATGSVGGSESVVKLDETFSVVWTHAFLGDGHVYPIPVAIGENDDIVVAGLFNGTFNFGAGPNPTKQQRSPFIVRLDSSGNLVNSKTFPETDIKWPWDEKLPLALAMRPFGEFAFSMRFVSTINLGGGAISSDGLAFDSALGRYGADGAHLSGTVITGQGEQETSALAVAPQGQLYWAVAYLGSVKYGNDVLVDVLPDDPWGSANTQGTVLLGLPP